jgi:hypothetical protein
LPTPRRVHPPCRATRPRIIRHASSKFGNTDLEVSAISLGCWIFGVDWWGHRTQEDCNRMCSFSRDLGITFFDNGDAYGNGRAEELFGRWMKDAKVDRSSIEIGGKVGYDFYSDPGEAGSHRERKQDFSPSSSASRSSRPSSGSGPTTSTCTWPTTSSSPSSATTCSPSWRRSRTRARSASGA